MNRYFKFKTITFILLLLSTFITLVAFSITVFYDSSKLLHDQVVEHSNVLVEHYEYQLVEHLEKIEDSALIIRSNERMVDSFYYGDLDDFIDTLSKWEESYEKAQYDFLAVSFYGTNKCFIYEGSLTQLENTSCIDLLVKNGNIDNYGWKLADADGTILGLYSIPLNNPVSGKVIGQLIVGIRLSDNRYLISRIMDENVNIENFDILYGNSPISSISIPNKELNNWRYKLFKKDVNEPSISNGKTSLGSKIRIKITSNDHPIRNLREEIFKTFLYSCLVALMISMLIAIVFSRFVDRQLQSLIIFAHQANSNKHTRWRKTVIVEFNDIGEEIIEIVKDLKHNEELLGAANQNLIISHGEKQKVLHHLIHSEEKQRLRLSNELHDDMGQLLAAVKINLYILRDELKAKDLSTNTLGTSLEIINSIYDTVYNRIMSLRPFEMNEYGLSVSLPQIAAIPQLKHLDYAIEIDIDQEKDLTEEVMSNLYRIAQEALSNVMKHANGSYVLLQLKDEEQGVRLVIEDDGNGIEDQDERQLSRGGFGLMSIRERAEYINGVLTIESGAGLSINVFVPSCHAYAQLQQAKLA